MLAFLLKSLSHYWRTNLAVVLGVVAGTAVIGGALVVGDSVRGSLRQMTLDRLGDIDFALTGHRFVREDLAAELAAAPLSAKPRIAPALVMTGGVQFTQPSADGSSESGSTSPKRTLRAGNVALWGVDERLWTLTRPGDVGVPRENEIILNRRLAEQLGLDGSNFNSKTHGKRLPDKVTVWVELPTSIPRDALLGKRSETTREIEFTVRGVLDEASGPGRLSLAPNQQLPLNAFVNLATLQSNLDLSKLEPSNTNRTGRDAKVNALFVSANDARQAQSVEAMKTAESLSKLLDETLRADDLGLRVVANEKRRYLSIESEQQILDDATAAAGEAAANARGAKTSPVFVYLANEISRGPIAENRYSRYSVVAGLDLPSEPPFGPFEFVGEAPKPLGEGAIETDGAGEIVINEWLAEDLEAKPGDTIRMAWHVVGSHGELPEVERNFVVKGIARLNGPADDRGLTPEVKGITDVKSFSDWDAPFPMNKKVTNRDDDYWEEHRATPKAFVSLKTARRLWTSRYGRHTSLRVAVKEGDDLKAEAQSLERDILGRLGPNDTGLVFQPVKFAGLAASSGSQDFTGLFLGFSFFLILSAAILIGLLFRLGLERRATQLGLLEAVGLPPKTVRRLFLGEGLLLVLVGGVLGVAAAVGYATLMVHGLKTWWIGAIGTRFLDVYVSPVSLAAGFLVSAVVALFALWWGLRQLKGISARDLLAGSTDPDRTQADRDARGRRAGRIALGSTAVAALLLVGVLSGLIPDKEAFAGFSWPVVCFFLVGTCLLTASLTFLSAWLQSDRTMAVRGAGLPALGRLGLRNAARQRQRSVLTVGLIASAAFVLAAVAAGHRDPSVEAPVKSSGNGGFLLVAESSSPILYDLGTAEGREKLDVTVDAQSTDPAERRDAALLSRMETIPFRVKPGEDASCLNIYRTRVPTLLGAPRRMIERGGFKFVGAGRDIPWTLLDEPLRAETSPAGDVPVYPALGDMNTLQYSLKKGVGDTIGVPDDERPKYRLKVVGMFDSSVFQGVLVLSESDFLKVAPERAGYQYFLIGLKDDAVEGRTGLPTRPAQPAPDAKEGERSVGLSPRSDRADAVRLTELLESKLAPFGFDAERVADRLAGFLAVQNTYLSTFQTLGGLGLLLGTFGLATVMLRNVLERRGELALLRAVGFRNSRIAALVLGENALLLLWGLVAGVGSALLAMSPHLRTVGGELPWRSLTLILAGVIATGMLSALMAVREAVRTPIVETLRGD